MGGGVDLPQGAGNVERTRYASLMVLRLAHLLLFATGSAVAEANLIMNGREFLHLQFHLLEPKLLANGDYAILSRGRTPSIPFADLSILSRLIFSTDTIRFRKPPMGRHHAAFALLNRL